MPLVILDRDGVVNEDSEAYIRSAAQWRPIPGSLEAVARLTAAGFDVVICTNQSGLARRLFTKADLEAIHERMTEAVEAAGGRLAAILVCPHGPDDGCDCRKPAPGLLHEAARRFGVDIAGVPFIGDSARDLRAASAAGARPILVLTGNGQRTRDNGAAEGVEVYRDLQEAANRLIEERNPQ